MYKAVEKLLELIGVPFTKSFLKKALIFHPDSPSLSAIGNLLNDMKIPNIATRLNVKQIQDIPLPALSFLSVEGKGGFVVLKNIDNSLSSR